MKVSFSALAVSSAVIVTCPNNAGLFDFAVLKAVLRFACVVAELEKVAVSEIVTPFIIKLAGEAFASFVVTTFEVTARLPVTVVDTTGVAPNTGLTRPSPVKVVPLDKNSVPSIAELRELADKSLPDVDAADQLLSTPFVDPVEEI